VELKLLSLLQAVHYLVETSHHLPATLVLMEQPPQQLQPQQLEAM